MEKEPKKEVINIELQQEILAMVEADQKMRKSGEWDEVIDGQNTERMKEIIEQYGWPGKSLVGGEAANGAWLLVQHADHDADFQVHALELLKEAVVKGEAERKNEAYLTDRVRVNKGEAQVFGTQFYTDTEGHFMPRPIEDPEHLDERRKEFGLELFSEYEKGMNEIQKKFPLKGSTG